MTFLHNFWQRRKNRKLLESHDVTVEIYSLLRFFDSFEFYLRAHLDKINIDSISLNKEDKMKLWDMYKNLNDISKSSILSAITDTARVMEKK